jgi:hypothetical protein
MHGRVSIETLIVPTSGKNDRIEVAADHVGLIVLNLHRADVDDLPRPQSILKGGTDVPLGDL